MAKEILKDEILKDEELDNVAGRCRRSNRSQKVPEPAVGV